MVSLPIKTEAKIGVLLGDATTMKHMFEDLLVIDAASFLAGPGAATIMADFGARVIN